LAKGTFIFVPAMLVGIGLARILTQATLPAGRVIPAASSED
jgi:hypothetical protein